MKNLVRVLSCAAAVLLAGCTSTRQFVPLPDQAKEIENPAMGRIYVMRPARAGSAVSMQVSDDGKPIGKTGPRGFLCWERPAGDTIVSSSSEGVSSAPLTVEPGGTYYIFQHLRMGLWIARSELEVVSAEEGRNVLKKCHAPKINIPAVAAVP